MPETLEVACAEKPAARKNRKEVCSGCGALRLPAAIQPDGCEVSIRYYFTLQPDLPVSIFNRAGAEAIGILHCSVCNDYRALTTGDVDELNKTLDFS